MFFYAFVDIAIRFFDTDQSLLIRFSVITVKQKEVVTLTRLAYVIRAKLRKLLRRERAMILLAISIIEKNLRLTVGKDFNESILVEKTITHRKRPSRAANI